MPFMKSMYEQAKSSNLGKKAPVPSEPVAPVGPAAIQPAPTPAPAPAPAPAPVQPPVQNQPGGMKEAAKAAPKAVSKPAK